MSDSKLKLQIVTALDNAGIKATKEQIDSLERQLQKVNNTTNGVDNVAKSLGKLKGPLGGLEKMLGGIGGTIGKVGGIATAVIGAFKTGWDIGTFVYEKIITPLAGIKDPIEELKKSNRALKKEYEEIAREVQRKKDINDDVYQHEMSKIDQQKEHIDKMTEAWIKTAKAKNAYNNIDLDEHEQQLESNRFAAVLERNLAGDTVGAEQMNAAYDIQKAMLEAQKRMRKQDEEIEILEGKLERREEKRYKMLDQIAAAQKRIKDLQAELTSAEEDGDGATNAKEHQRAIDRAEKRLRRGQAELERYEKSLAEFDADESEYIELDTARKKKLLLEQKGLFEVEKAYGKLEVANERAKRDRAKKEEEAQQLMADYYRKAEQMAEDDQYAEFKHKERLTDLWQDWNDAMNDFEDWAEANPDKTDEADKRLRDIVKRDERANLAEYDSYWSGNRQRARQLDEMNISASRKWDTITESISKIPVIQDKYMEQIYNATQNNDSFEQGMKYMADALMTLMEAKR